MSVHALTMCKCLCGNHPLVRALRWKQERGDLEAQCDALKAQMAALPQVELAACTHAGLWFVVQEFARMRTRVKRRMPPLCQVVDRREIEWARSSQEAAESRLEALIADFEWQRAADATARQQLEAQSSGSRPPIAVPVSDVPYTVPVCTCAEDCAFVSLRGAGRCRRLLLMLMRLDALMQERYWLCNEHSRAKRMSSRQPARREMRHAGVKQVLDVLNAGSRCS